VNQSYSDVGIVLRSRDSGEADKFISIITQEHGLINCIARGARRITSKKSPHLDVFNLIKFQVGRGESPLYLNQAESIAFYPNIKSDFGKIGIGMTILEILLNTVPSDVEDQEIFLSLKSFLDGLEKAEDSKAVNNLGRQFGLYILRHLGYPPPKSPGSDNLSTYFESIMNRKIISKEIR
jgi:DNA repair protein RecO (recombination protein O)